MSLLTTLQNVITLAGPALSVAAASPTPEQTREEYHAGIERLLSLTDKDATFEQLGSEDGLA